MPTAIVFILVVALLLLAARLFLRGERLPPVRSGDDPTAGFRDPARPYRGIPD